MISIISVCAVIVFYTIGGESDFPKVLLHEKTLSVT